MGALSKNALPQGELKFDSHAYAQRNTDRQNVLYLCHNAAVRRRGKRCRYAAFAVQTGPLPTAGEGGIPAAQGADLDDETLIILVGERC